MIVTASVLNVRSGPGTNFRVMSRIVRDQQVNVSETIGDWSWVSPGNGWVSRAYLTPIRSVRVPTGIKEIIDLFGKAGGPAASAGRVDLPGPLKLGWSSGSVTRVACHAELVQIFSDVFRKIHDQGLWDLLKTFDGIYNNRSTVNGRKKSTHAWGIAVDLNASTNRYGTEGDMDSRIVEIFENHGFKHLKHDPMHFQYAQGY